MEKSLQTLTKSKFKFSILVVLFLAGCSSIQQFNNNLPSIKVEYVNSENVVVSRSDLPQKVIVEFNVIPGAIWGRPLSYSQYLDVVGVGSSLNTSFPELLEKIKTYATPMLNSEANYGLEISPKDTRLARFGTFTYDVESKENIGGTGFGSPDPKIYALVLTYFDRPAELIGMQDMYGEIAEFDIEVRNEGLVWLKVERLSPNHYLYTVHEMVGDEFLFIHPNESIYTET